MEKEIAQALNRNNYCYVEVGPHGDIRSWDEFCSPGSSFELAPGCEGIELTPRDRRWTAASVLAAVENIRAARAVA